MRTAWNLGLKMSEEQKVKLSKIHKGKILSEEHKRAISNGVKKHLPSTAFKKNVSTWNAGTKGIMKAWNKGLKTGLIPKTAFKKGQKPWNWQGGISFKPYPLGWTKTFKEQIRYRDGYKCQVCGMPEVENGRKLDVHHIDYDKQNIAIENLISLCKKCHRKTNGRRSYWIRYFKEN